MRPIYNLGRQVGLLARLWRTELDNRLRPLGLSQARWLLLVHLSDAPDGLAQLDLAVRAGVSGPTLVRQIDQLEEAGLVERKEDPNDRRVKRVTLTAAGVARFQEVDAIAAALRHEVLEGSEPKEVEAAMELTRRLINRFDTLAKTPAKGAA
jgi:MarR family transcriptional regulator for hemolysin